VFAEGCGSRRRVRFLKMPIKVDFITKAMDQYSPAIQWLAILFIAILMAYFVGKFIWTFGMRWEK